MREHHQGNEIKMAARTTLLMCACVFYAIAVPAKGICPDGCFCVAFETDCSGIELTEFPSESKIWKGTEYLYLNDNNLDTVARIDLPNLDEYKLEKNRILNIEWDAFDGVPKLVKLNLSQNLLADLVKQEFSSLSVLENLDLSYNKLRRIGELAFNGMFLKKLEELDLSHNEIESIDTDSFAGLKTLKYLWLNNNKLKSIQHHHFNGVENLWYLFLHSNQLQTIGDKSFYPMENLVTLTLNKNALKSVQKMALYNLKNVEKLDISDNQLTDVPVEALDDLLSLTSLNMGGNPITKLAKADFPHTHNQLVNLVLSNMANLQNVEAGAFDNLPNLANVNISNNPKLTSLPPTLFFMSFHKLRNVDLSNNSLSVLDRQLLPWEKLFTLSVTGNKWRCDCTCRWMKNYTFEMDLR